MSEIQSNVRYVSALILLSQLFSVPCLAQQSRSFIEEDLTEVNLSSRNLTYWTIESSTLDGANLANANLMAAEIGATGCCVVNRGPITTLIGAELSNANLSRSKLEANFDEANLTGVDLSDAMILGGSFDGTNLQGANLTNARIYRNALAGATLDSVNISNATFYDLDISPLAFESTANYRNGNMRSLTFIRCNLQGWDLSEQDLSDSEFREVDFSDVDFTGASIRDVDFNQSNLSQEQLMATANYKARDLRGIRFRGLKLDGWDFSDQDLSDSDLTSDLSQANFTNATIVGVQFPFQFQTQDRFHRDQLISTLSFQQKDLQKVNVSVDLSELDLSGFNLSGAQLGSSDLTNSDLSGAEIVGAKFSNTNLTEAQLMSTASFQRQDLRGVALPSSAGEWALQGQNLEGARFNAPDNPSNIEDATIVGTTIRFKTSQNHEAIALTASYKLKDMRGVDLPSDLIDWDLSGQNLTGATLGQSRMRNVDLRGADLSNALMVGEFQFENVEFDSATLYNQWSYFGFDPVAAGLAFVETPAGDFDANGAFDTTDLEGLETAIRNEVHHSFGGSWDHREKRFDLNEDRIVDALDLQAWIALTRNLIGDADLNGAVDFADFLSLSENFGEKGGWAQGDFDSNGVIEFGDFLLMGYAFAGAANIEATSVTAVVPEPESLSLLFCTAMLVGGNAVGRKRDC